jgi:hypothetical protein
MDARMKKLILLLTALLPAYSCAMSGPRVARPSLVCHTVGKIVKQITQYEQLSVRKQSELEQLLKKCEQEQLLFNPIDEYGHYTGSQLWNKWCGYENGIKLEVLNLLKPFIKRGGTPFLEHCLASAIRYDELDKVKILVEDLQVNVNAIDSRDANDDCGTPAPMLDMALWFNHENSLPILELLLQNGANTETVLWHGGEITPLGYLLYEIDRPCAEKHKSNMLGKIALLLQYGANIDAIDGRSTSLVQCLEQNYDFYQQQLQRPTKDLEKKQALINEIYALITDTSDKMAECQRPLLAPCFDGHQGISDLVLQYVRPNLAQEQQAYYEKKCDKKIAQQWPEVAGDLTPFLAVDELPESDPGYGLERENPVDVVGEFMDGYVG